MCHENTHRELLHISESISPIEKLNSTPKSHFPKLSGNHRISQILSHLSRHLIGQSHHDEFPLCRNSIDSSWLFTIPHPVIIFSCLTSLDTSRIICIEQVFYEAIRRKMPLWPLSCVLKVRGQWRRARHNRRIMLLRDQFSRYGCADASIGVN